jgi:hypothetical protein
MSVIYMILTLTSQHWTEWEQTYIFGLLHTIVIVAWWIASSFEQFEHNMAYYEQFVKWLKSRWKMKMRNTRWKVTSTRYYVRGVKGKSFRICEKRVCSQYRYSTRVPGAYIGNVFCLATNCRSRLHEDSTWLGIDTLSTYCITTNNVEDLVGSTEEIQAGVTGIAGTEVKASITMRGEGVYKIL